MTPLDVLRRRLGLGFIMGAAGMTVLGLTLLEPRLRGFWFIIYWLVCAALAVLALVSAALDLVVVRARARAEREQLARESAAQIKAAIREGQMGEKNSTPSGAKRFKP